MTLPQYMRCKFLVHTLLILRLAMAEAQAMPERVLAENVLKDYSSFLLDRCLFLRRRPWTRTPCRHPVNQIHDCKDGCV